MKRMRYPSLSLHGIFGGAEPEATIIPHEVTGEFSIRFVIKPLEFLFSLKIQTLVSYQTKLQTQEACMVW